MSSICPNCGAEDSLRQEVTAEFTTTRPVNVGMADGKPAVSYGMTGRSDGDETVVGTQEIECTQCEATWYDEDELLNGKHVEHGCTACDWWGFNPWQHGLERPDCSGEVKPRDEIGAFAEIAA